MAVGSLISDDSLKPGVPKGTVLILVMESYAGIRYKPRLGRRCRCPSELVLRET